MSIVYFLMLNNVDTNRNGHFRCGLCIYKRGCGLRDSIASRVMYHNMQMIALSKWSMSVTLVLWHILGPIWTRLFTSPVVLSVLLTVSLRELPLFLIFALDAVT
ncbi:hypothetical protein BBOV_II000735 [Babesia bovis T2Bo]|uniref:hypothetical protein n=1 Tax=Babesia bovis T2Bo TaxID=484906 RepID=UPI001C35D56F|nr:hypothetical protein BBOV_II000735 [Babesia bovis T2Bo]KAG6440112.1 hypothetical protein BBOV_II000735 [Babesia bovis T2Bo]